MELHTRARWGARYGDGVRPAPLPAAEVWLHHSEHALALTAAADRQADYAAMRQLEEIGQRRFGAGVSYTFAVFPSGRVMHGHSPNREGTHTLHHNTRGRAIVLVGDYRRRAPAHAMVDAVAQLLHTGAGRRWWTRAQLTGGHRDVVATLCPGDGAYPLIPVINRIAAQLGQSTPAAPTVGQHLPRLEAGDRSPAVRRWQEWLTATYSDDNPYRPTGYFGDLTIAGTAAFQKLAGITGADANGRHVGPRTNAAAFARGYRG